MGRDSSRSVGLHASQPPMQSAQSPAALNAGLSAVSWRLMFVLRIAPHTYTEMHAQHQAVAKVCFSSLHIHAVSLLPRQRMIGNLPAAMADVQARLVVMPVHQFTRAAAGNSQPWCPDSKCLLFGCRNNRQQAPCITRRTQSSVQGLGTRCWRCACMLTLRDHNIDVADIYCITYCSCCIWQSSWHADTNPDASCASNSCSAHDPIGVL